MFAKDASKASGLKSWCRSCVAKKENRPQRAMQEREKYHKAKEDFRQLTEHSVYFIASPYKPEHVKIGYTSNLRKRFKDFLAATSGRLLLLCLLPVDGPDQELSFHRQFDHLRIQNTEWFVAKSPILRFLSSSDQSLAKKATSLLTQGQQSRIVIPPIERYIDFIPFIG